MSHEAYLRNSLAKYQHPDIAKRDTLTVFNSYKDLRPVLDTFVFNDGTRKELLCLDGTVPVPYKGNTYNIPICLWLMDTHPYNGPMVFVKPTSTMLLKTGRHVDGTGRVYLPYLHEWKHPQADLLGLFQVLIIVFGEDPPVYSKFAAPTTQDGNTPCLPPRGGSPSTQAMEPPRSNTDDELQKNIASLMSVVHQLQTDNDEKDARIKVLEARIDDLEQYSHINDDVSIVNGWLQWCCHGQSPTCKAGTATFTGMTNNNQQIYLDNVIDV